VLGFTQRLKTKVDFGGNAAADVSGEKPADIVGKPGMAAWRVMIWSWLALRKGLTPRHEEREEGDFP
jgi:hypothetical protein